MPPPMTTRSNSRSVSAPMSLLTPPRVNWSTPTYGSRLVRQAGEQVLRHDGFVPASPFGGTGCPCRRSRRVPYFLRRTERWMDERVSWYDGIGDRRIGIHRRYSLSEALAGRARESESSRSGTRWPKARTSMICRDGGATFVEGSVGDPDRRREALAGADVVHHIAAVMREADMPDSAFLADQRRGNQRAGRGISRVGREALRLLQYDGSHGRHARGAGR